MGEKCMACNNGQATPDIRDRRRILPLVLMAQFVVPLGLFGLGALAPLVVLGRNNPSLYTVNGRPLYVHLNGLAIVLLK